MLDIIFATIGKTYIYYKDEVLLLRSYNGDKTNEKDHFTPIHCFYFILRLYNGFPQYCDTGNSIKRPGYIR